MSTCEENSDVLGSSWLLVKTSIVTCIVSCVFVGVRMALVAVRGRYACVQVAVVGAGPIGLMSALIAAKSRHSTRVTVYEQKLRSALLNQYHQVSTSP